MSFNRKRKRKVKRTASSFALDSIESPPPLTSIPTTTSLLTFNHDDDDEPQALLTKPTTKVKY